MSWWRTIRCRINKQIIKSTEITVSGILDIEDNDIFIEVEDKGVFSLKQLLSTFDGLDVRISCSHEEE